MQKVLAAHIIISVYGFWLPNDPRGSWSEFVASWELFKFGRTTKVHTRESVAHISHDHDLRISAKKALNHAPVLLNGMQARAIARGFAQAALEGEYPIHACSILPDHVHLVVGRHQRPFEQITSHLKSRATRQLRAENRHPLAKEEKADGSVPCVWARKLWKVYCDNPGHVINAIRYVEKNPVREQKKHQTWSFVIPWVG